jgi:hypothetical protein
MCSADREEGDGGRMGTPHVPPSKFCKNATLRVEFPLNLFVTLPVICQKLPVPLPRPLEFKLSCIYVKMENELVPTLQLNFRQFNCFLDSIEPCTQFRFHFNIKSILPYFNFKFKNSKAKEKNI